MAQYFNNADAQIALGGGGGGGSCDFGEWVEIDHTMLTKVGDPFTLETTVPFAGTGGGISMGVTNPGSTLRSVSNCLAYEVDVSTVPGIDLTAQGAFQAIFDVTDQGENVVVAIGVGDSIVNSGPAAGGGFGHRSGAGNPFGAFIINGGGGGHDSAANALTDVDIWEVNVRWQEPVASSNCSIRAESWGIMSATADLNENTSAATEQGTTLGSGTPLTKVYLWVGFWDSAPSGTEEFPDFRLAMRSRVVNSAFPV